VGEALHLFEQLGAGLGLVCREFYCGDEFLSLLKWQREDDVVGDETLFAGAEEPATVGLLGQLFDA
jgi:hypothetical protein